MTPEEHLKSRQIVPPSGALGELWRYIDSTALMSQPLLNLGAAITIMGTVLGRRVSDASGCRTNIYVMGVAPSSSGKNHGQQSIQSILREIGYARAIGGQDVTSDAAIERRLEREPVTCFCWDEIGHLLETINTDKTGSAVGKIVPTLMKLYSSASGIYAGKEYADADKPTRILDQPCCSIYGTTTPDRLGASFSSSQISDGWLGRCLVLQGSIDLPEKRRRIMRPDMPDGVAEMCTRWLAWKPNQTIDKKALNPSALMHKPLIANVSDEAERMFENLDSLARGMMGTRVKGAEIWGKAEELARRVALIHAGGRCGPDDISVEAVDAKFAYALVCHAVKSLVSFVGHSVADSKREAEYLRLVRVVRDARRAGLSRSDLVRKTQWVRRQDRDGMIADAVESGMLVEVLDDSPTRSGMRYIHADHVVAEQA